MTRLDADPPFPIRPFPSRGGVYAFLDAAGGLIQLGAAENLRHAIQGRLYPPAEARGPRADLLAVTHAIAWIPTYSQFETYLRFHETAWRLLRPEHLQMCSFGPAYFAVIDLGDHFPRWRVGSDPFSGRSASVGPFATSGACQDFIHRIEDLFALCRYHHILVQAPHGAACTYFEMGRCPAPCDGSISLEQYRDMLQQSVDAVTTRAAALPAEIQRRMAAAAAERDFERAARLKHDWAAAQEVGRTLDRVQARYEDFRYLAVQRGPGRSVKPFFIHQGRIRAGSHVALRRLEEAAENWVGELRRDQGPGGEDPQFELERVWLVCHFLQRRGRAGLFLHAREVPDAAALSRRVREVFATPAPRPPAGGKRQP